MARELHGLVLEEVDMTEGSPGGRMTFTLAGGWMRLVMALLASWLIAPVASAEGMVRAAEHGDGIAVAVRADGGDREWSVWFAPDGSTFGPVAIGPDRWVHEIAVLDDGALLVVHGAIPRQGPVRVSRFGDRAEHVEIAEVDAIGDPLIVARGARVALLGPRGAMLSTDGGRTFARAAEWSHGYGFYAATATMSPAGVIDVLVPAFETCGSGDVIEDVQHHRVGRGGGAIRIPDLDDLGFYAPVLGDAGAVYIARPTSGRSFCELTVSTRRGQHRLQSFDGDTPCWMRGRTVGRRTVVALGEVHVLRVNPRGAMELGVVDAGVDDVTPWRRGALVWTQDDRLVALPPGGAPRTLWSVPPAP